MKSIVVLHRLLLVLAIGLFQPLIAVSAQTTTSEASIPTGLSPQVKELIGQLSATDPSVRGKAAERLGEMGESVALAVPILIRLLTDGSEINGTRKTDGIATVADKARKAITSIGSPAVEPCIVALEQASVSRRNALIHQLSQINDPRAVRALADLLANKDPEVRSIVIRELRWCPGLLSESYLIPILIKASSDPNRSIRYETAGTLGNFRDSRVVDTLIAMLKDTDSSVRSNAARSLGDTEDIRAVPVLVAVLQNVREIAYVRAVAASALGETGDADLVHLLGSVFQDRREPVSLRFEAGRAMEHFKDQQTSGILHAVLDDSKDIPRVREAAMYAIAKIEGANAIPCLTKFAKAKDEAKQVRLRAALCLAGLNQGILDDIEIVRVLGYFHDPSTREDKGFDEIAVDWISQRDARQLLDGIAANAKSEAVRSAAVAARKSVPDEPFRINTQYVVRVLSGVYAVVLVGLLGVVGRWCIRGQRLTYRLLFLLLALGIVGIPIVMFGFHAWR